jgi:acyl-coenzyme A thioesterase PaaI-like protein
MNKTAQLIERLKKFPFGLWLATRAICFKAPYFASIRPVFTRLEPGFGEARLKKRRSVQNHIGTVHAIAMANLCELLAGTTLEITLPSTHRWIPKSMKIDYVAKAATDVFGKTAIQLGTLPDAGSLNVHVDVTDTSGKIVVTADIEMYISKKK